MKALLQFLSWPTLCGLLAAIIILQQLDSSEKQYNKHNSFAPSVQRAAPSVVNIYTRKIVKQKLPPLLNDPLFRHFFEKNGLAQRDRIERSLGSGVIMDNRGFLLTNHHVISGADEILILLQDGREALATVIGSDPATDLAVLNIDLENLNPIQVGNPNTAEVGDIVLAIGNPYGFGQTVTQGIISATGRYGLHLNIYENYLQTDAAINPGNSGGALINTKGELLGINSAIYSRSGGSNGIGLAIPSDSALMIMNDLINYGQVIRGWLGIEVKSLNAAASQALQLPKGTGVMITNMIIDSPAHQAELRVGDVITHINGIGMSDGNIGMNLIAQTRPGETVTINIIRDQQAAKISVIAGRRPE